MRADSLAIVSMLGFAGCATQGPPEIVIERRPSTDKYNDDGRSYVLFHNNMEQHSVSEGLPPQAMKAVSTTCGIANVLSEDDVEMTEVSVEHVHFIRGGGASTYTYTFRCPEPGKEIQ